MLTGPPRRRRARPVADAPIDSLLSRSEDLAKGWLLALLERAPLDEAPRILATDLTRDGPSVCEAMLRALVDDDAERRLEAGGTLEPLVGRIGLLAGASGAEATSRAADALHAIVWTALRAELQSSDPELITAVVERLTQVTELVRAAALRQGDGVGPTPLAAVRDPLEGVVEPLITDRRREGHRAARRASQPEADSRSWVSDDRADEALWVGALEDEIARSGGAPLSLVLAELEDADKIAAAEKVPAATFAAFATAVRDVVRRQDILVSETDARAWVIARDTTRRGAQALGSRISVAVRESQSWRGAPMVASVGVAVLGEDGRTPSELIEAAEEARFAAEAGGLGILSDDEASR